MSELKTVREHYTIEGISARIENALQQAGFGVGRMDWSALAPLDQFHVRGLPATQELAEGLELKGGEMVLDVGSGLGGPARFLAATFDCRVTGIDLSQPFVDAAAMLSARTGLSDRLNFVQGDATELPFAPESFDHAWTQHVAMNIQNKAGLYAGIHRVLKKGGRLAIYDAVKGENEPILYPVPWASEPGISFVASPDAMTQALEEAGFRIVSAADTTDKALVWFAELQAAQQAGGAASPLNLGVVIGPDAREATGNFARNIKEGRIRLMQFSAQKD